MGELTHHLGYAKGEAKPETELNHRIATHGGRLPGFDDHVLSLYAHGTTMREIEEHLTGWYQVDLAPECISAVTDAVLEEVTAWQQRPLDPC